MLTSNEEKLIKDHMQLYDDVPDKLINVVDKSEGRIFSETLKATDFETDSEGNFLANQNNQEKLSTLPFTLNDIIISGAISVGVVDFLKSLNKSASSTRNILSSTLDNEIEISQSATDVFAVFKDKATNALTGEGFTGSVIETLNDEISSTVLSGGNKEALRTTLVDLLVSDEESNSLIHNHFQRESTDRYAFTDRAFTEVLANENDAVWRVYRGGLLKDTRKFCTHRNNRYFHIKEIEEWGDPETFDIGFSGKGKWQGKIKGTNRASIKIFLGGWNCKHSIMPVSIFRVPKEDILRNISEGNFTPTPKEAEMLGL